MSNPFDLADDTAYRVWRDTRLAAYPRRVDELIVPLADPRRIDAAERDALADRCARANMAIYSATHLPAADKSLALQLGRQLGLERLEGNYLADEDGLSSITPNEDDSHVRGDYIPYTHKPINWHTDGYYNTLERRILGMTLHCAQDAEAGGENALLDHEIAYILLRDENPEYIRALAAPEAMTIPPRTDDQGVARPAQPGPVFSVNADGTLHMRYTARTVSIAWATGAVAALTPGVVVRVTAATTPARASAVVVCRFTRLLPTAQ